MISPIVVPEAASIVNISLLSDVNAVVTGIVSGAIDAIATDHAPHPGSEKMQEFEKCPFGILGLETALGVSLENLLHTEKIGLMRLVELFTAGPARVLGINRGTLAEGAPGAWLTQQAQLALKRLKQR